MSNTATDTLKRAIQTKSNVAFIYDGHIRECSPHALGQKDGKINVLVYQFGGSTSKGPVITQGPDNWRCMNVAKITDLKVIAGDWHTFDNHSQPSTCIDSYLAQVSY